MKRLLLPLILVIVLLTVVFVSCDEVKTPTETLGGNNTVQTEDTTTTQNKGSTTTKADSTASTTKYKGGYSTYVPGQYEGNNGESTPSSDVTTTVRPNKAPTTTTTKKVTTTTKATVKTTTTRKVPTSTPGYNWDINGALPNTQTPSVPTIPGVTQVPNNPGDPDCSHTFHAATCTLPQTCAKCGAQRGTPLGHNFSKQRCIDTACNNGCGLILQGLGSDTTNEDAHEFQKTIVPANCYEAGYTQNECLLCGNCTQSDWQSALGHNYGTGSCTLDIACKNGCGIVRERGEHNFAEGNECTGLVCIKCTATKAGKGHKLVNGACTRTGCNFVAAPVTSNKNDSPVVTFKPGSSSGTTTTTTTTTTTVTTTTAPNTTACPHSAAKCVDSLCEKGCGATIPGLGQNQENGHSYTDSVINPTCEGFGYTKHECNLCGKVYNDSFTSPKGHDFSGVSCTVEAFCKNGCGEKHERTAHEQDETGTDCTGYYCKKCGGVLKEALGHQLVDGTCTRPGCNFNVPNVNPDDDDSPGVDFN